MTLMHTHSVILPACACVSLLVVMHRMFLCGACARECVCERDCTRVYVYVCVTDTGRGRDRDRHTDIYTSMRERRGIACTHM